MTAIALTIHLLAHVTIAVRPFSVSIGFHVLIAMIGRVILFAYPRLFQIGRPTFTCFLGLIVMPVFMGFSEI